ncbi:SOSS complex subunit C-like [Xenia sp. Carnegie-2017]|uniref:SOSS complex subunit C-like n=1 Tax=Xenia sp. Carnegie-2017 TaxID=2897299 RepID=UPI001F047812|nr:SOSS complex subunit C-like [Xenia sp. Carnegie-2017]
MWISTSIIEKDMASQGELQNRNKILQEIFEKKKQLGQQTNTTTTPFLPNNSPKEPTRHASDAHIQAQRQALEHANSISWGYFIMQDSIHGNLILPVIPRFERDS